MTPKLSGPTRRKLRNIPESELHEVLAWVRSGERAFEIMERYGIRLDTVYRLEYPAKGLPGRTPRTPDAVRAAVMAEYAAGMPMKEITGKYGLHRCTVWQFRRETGTPARFPQKARRRGTHKKQPDYFETYPMHLPPTPTGHLPDKEG